MNDEQKERIFERAEQRQPVYRVTMYDTDGGVMDEHITNDLSEAQSIIANYEDAIGVVVTFEVVQ